MSPTRERPDATTRLTRRRILAAGGAIAIGAVAGCTSVTSDGDPDEQEYRTLERTPTYLADGVDLTVPDEVPTVNAPTNADLVVLPGDTEVNAEQAVDWLADQRILALLGATAERTWLAWERSDAYAQTFEDEGVADSEPDPQLLVAGAVNLHVPTYNHTWGDGPRDRDVLQKLDEDLADIESRRSGQEAD